MFNSENSDRAERGVLGCMLRDNRVVAEVGALVSAADFRGDAHQKIAACILELCEQGQPADMVTVVELLNRRGQVGDVGYPYLHELWSQEPTGAGAEHYAAIVRDASVRRQVVRLSHEMVQRAVNPTGPASEILEALEQGALAISSVGVGGRAVHVKVALAEAAARLDTPFRLGDSPGCGLPTGLVDLDERTAGLQDSELIVVGARPSVGKTAFGLAVAKHAALAGQAVLFISLEQARVELGERLLSAHARVDGHKIRLRKLSREEGARVADAQGVLAEMRLFIEDTPGQGMFQIAAEARRLKQREDVRLVVVDYLQRVATDNEWAKRNEQVANISRRLKALARELKIPVLTLALLGRSAEMRERPRLADLGESSAIEADADVVILLHEPEGSPGEREAIIAKQRNGPVGTVRLAFRKEFMEFCNFAPGGDVFGGIPP